MSNYSDSIYRFIRKAKKETGSTLIVVLVLLATMVALAMGAIKLTQLNLESSNAHNKGKRSFYAAEVGLDAAVNDIISEFENLSIYTTTANDGGSPGKTISNYRGYDVYYNVTNPLDRFLYQTVLGKGTIYHYAHTFDIEAESDSLTGKAKETLRERIRILETPLVQYFAFYAGDGDLADLELYPGADMNIWGRMHANRDMYIVGRGNDINIMNYDLDGNFSPHFMSMGGEFRGKQKSGNTYSKTDTFVKKTNSLNISSDPSSDSEFRQLPLSINSGNEDTEEPNFNGYVNVNENKYSAPSQTQFFRNGFYEQRAEDPQNPRIDSMKIVGTGGAIEIWVSRPSLLNVTTDVLAGNLLNAGGTLSPAPVRETAGTDTLYDTREGKYVDFTDIDLHRLGQWYKDYLDSQGLNWAGDGMLIYTSRSPTAPIPFANNGARREAIRLLSLGGSPAKVWVNTTVATDNPIYIQGDFNTDTTRGVALVSDATNILSTSFTSKDDSVTYPKAGNTTVNAAFFSGIKPNPVGGTRIGGGLHNYPRMHENWGNDRTLTISGSFISLWESTQATGDWCHGSSSNCYLRPVRNFGWDVRFQDPNFWPPFIPSIFSVERVGFIE